MYSDVMRHFTRIALVLVVAVSCTGSPQGHQTIAQAELLTRLQSTEPPLVLDVRAPGEFGRGHVPTAVNIPYMQVGARIRELGQPNGRDIVVYCEAGPRAERAEAVLKQAGFERVYHLEGDMATWRRNRLPVELR
jgi:rhodanese-related sulfurtransferase